MRTSPSARITNLWTRLQGVPGGRWLFGRLLGLMVPYTGTIKPHVLVLEPGHAVVVMRDRRGVRNHLSSVHALALGNLGELTTGLATMAGMPPNVRSIPTHLSIEFVKKGRGELRGECRTEIPEVTGDVDHDVTSEITDAAGDVVARTTVRWRLSPR